MALLPPDWRRDPVAAGVALAAATAVLAARETAALPPGTAQEKLYYYEQPFVRFTWDMVGPNGPLIHGPGAWALYGGFQGVPVASNSAVFACLAVIAKGHQEAPLRVFRKTRDGKEEWLDDHPFQAFVDDPHPALTKVEVDWWLEVAKHVHGNAYLRKVRAAGGNVVETQLLSPLHVTPVTTKEDRARGVFISHYRWEYEPSKYEEIPAADVVHFRMGVDDQDHRLGCSPLQRAVREVCTDEEAMTFTKALLTNMGAVGLVVTLPPNVPMTREEAEDLRQRIDDKFTADGRGRTTVLTNGATMTQTGFNPQQLNLQDAHRIPEERIAAVLGVHPMVAGLGAGLQRSTFSNYAEARDALFEQTIIPLYVAEAATWQKQLLRTDFDTDPRVSVRYDVTDVRALQEDQNEVYARLSVAVEKGWVKRNEARAEVGLPPVEGWDEEDEQSAVDAAAALTDATAPALPAPGEDEPPPPRGEQRARRLTPQERKARAVLRAFPGALDAVHDLTAPLVARDLEALFADQKRRVQGRLRAGG